MEPISVMEAPSLPEAPYATDERMASVSARPAKSQSAKPKLSKSSTQKLSAAKPPPANGNEDKWTWLETLEIEELIWPDHTQLPDEDDSIVNNFQEHPQSSLLSNTILPVLLRLHPDEQFAIGQDSGIYWGLPDRPELIELNRELLAKKRKSTFPRKTTTAKVTSPDWYYVPGAPPLLKGKVRRSYVMWKELIAPVIVIEFVSGDGSEERDTTPITGKFWSYEQVIRPAYYAIYEVKKAAVEVHRFVGDHFELAPANERGHYPIEPLGVELGIWHGKYEHIILPWLRWWDAEGNLLLTGDERARQEHERARQEHERAEQEHQLRLAAEAEIARLRALLSQNNQ